MIARGRRITIKDVSIFAGFALFVALILFCIFKVPT
jgi:hypothetical protein